MGRTGDCRDGMTSLLTCPGSVSRSKEVSSSANGGYGGRYGSLSGHLSDSAFPRREAPCNACPILLGSSSPDPDSLIAIWPPG